MRRAAQKFLPKLNTFFGSYTDDPQWLAESMWHERSKAKVDDEEDEGLQVFHIAWLERLSGADDLAWFSTVKFQEVGYTDSAIDLHAVLEVAKTTLETLRLERWTFGEDSAGIDPIHTYGFRKLAFPNLAAFSAPKAEASAASLNTLIDVGGQKKSMFFGFVHSLLRFDFLSLKQVMVSTYQSKDLEALEQGEEESKLKTTLFLERNPSLLDLGLLSPPSAGLQDGEDFHLNFILQSLSIMCKNANPDEPEREPQSLLLPELRGLAIYDPKALNKKLLKQLWQIRKTVSNEFQIAVYTGGKWYTIDRSGGEGWLDEAEDCECSCRLTSRSLQVSS